MPGKNGFSLPHFPRHFKYFHKKCMVKEYTLLSPAICNLTFSLSPATSHPPPATYHLPPIFILRIKSAWQSKKCLAAVLPRCRIFCTPAYLHQICMNCQMLHKFCTLWHPDCSMVTQEKSVSLQTLSRCTTLAHNFVTFRCFA